MAAPAVMGRAVRWERKRDATHQAMPTRVIPSATAGHPVVEGTVQRKILVPVGRFAVRPLVPAATAHLGQSLSNFRDRGARGRLTLLPRRHRRICRRQPPLGRFQP